MTVHTAVFTALLTLLTALLAVAFAPGDIATLRRWWAGRRQAAADWRNGSDIIAGLATITAELPVLPRPPWHDVPPRDSSPACRDDRGRCRECRLGGDCRDIDSTGRPAYAAGLPLPRAGRHSTALAVARWLAGDWWQAELPIRLRRELGRAAGTGTIPAGAT